MKVNFSEHITKKQARNIYSAFHYAQWKDSPMTRHVTILWHLVKGYPRDGTIEQQSEFARKRTEAFRRKFADFCRYHQQPNFLVYALENPPHMIANLAKFVHTHIACHVPDHLMDRFEALLSEWTYGNQKYRRKANTVQVNSHPDHWTIMSYILKGVRPDQKITTEDSGEIYLRDLLKITNKADKWDQGLIFGKRMGMSKALDITARSRDNFIEPAFN